MIITYKDNLTILQPEEDYKYITNGEVFSTLVYLGKNDKIENWHDTNDEPLLIEDIEGV